MAKKIRRPHMINGTQCWISGNTEKEVRENAIRLMGLCHHVQENGEKKSVISYRFFRCYPK